MNKNQFNYGRIIDVTIVSAFVCAILWATPLFSRTEKDKSGTATSKPVVNTDATTPTTQEGLLVRLLEADGLINEVKGFLVEKKQNRIYIDGAQLPENIAGKYTSQLGQDEIRVEVYPFIERLRQHPDAGFIQLLLPVMLSSPCVDTKPKKEGC